MHLPTQELPGTNTVWAGMAVGYLEVPAGTDFTPLLEGLPDDACQCPHWGYVIKGAFHVRYTDGTEEVNEAGTAFYWPAGHTGWAEEDTAFIDFSPEQDFKELMAHIGPKMG